MGLVLDAGQPAIAIDPGLVTGVAVLDPQGQVTAFQAQWEEAFDTVRDALALLSTEARVAMIVESFVITGNTAKMDQTDIGWPLEGIGVARFLALRHHAELVLQRPVEAKRFATDKRLRAAGWHKPTPGGHLNDAMRHLYLWAVKTGRLTPPPGVV